MRKGTHIGKTGESHPAAVSISIITKMILIPLKSSEAGGKNKKATEKAPKKLTKHD